jgi:hypothetical protein
MGMGNTTSIADQSGNRTYGYQDYQYFLTSAFGPWGTKGWTYDRLGNRLSAIEPCEPAVLNYTYLLNGLGGRTPN